MVGIVHVPVLCPSMGLANCPIFILVVYKNVQRECEPAVVQIPLVITRDLATNGVEILDKVAV